MKFPYTVKSDGLPTATIMAGAAFNAGFKYMEKYAPNFPRVMPANVVYNGSRGKQFRQEIYSEDTALILWITEEFN